MNEKLARTGLVAGLLGAVSALLLALWPPQVATDRFSYPLDADWHVAFQAFFALQHVALAALFVVLLAGPRVRRSRTARTALATAVVGMLGLAACEVYAATAAGAVEGSTLADRVETAYGVPTVLIGLGMLVAGLAARDRLVAALGGYVFVVLVPALFGSMVVGRAAIGIWMLGFAWLARRLAEPRPGSLGDPPTRRSGSLSGDVTSR
jgi:hypothetical protein